MVDDGGMLFTTTSDPGDEEQRMLAEELEEKKDDVVKKGNVNDFYSNLLKSNIAMGREIRETPTPVKEEKARQLRRRDSDRTTRQIQRPRGRGGRLRPRRRRGWRACPSATW